MPTRPVSNSEPVQEIQMLECYDCNEEFPENEMNASPHGERVCENCEMDNYFWCESCGDGDYMDYCCWSDYHEASYCESCYPGNGDDVDLNSFDDSSIDIPTGNTYFNNEFKRMAGVEIETIYPYEEADAHHPTSFRRTSDGSISSDGNGRGYEYVSKPMNGDHFWNEIEKMTGYLGNHNFWVNKSCGLHVHIDARDLFYKELKGIMLVTKSFEKTIKNMMPRSRRKTNWCKDLPFEKNTIRRIYDDSDFISRWYDHTGEMPSSDKYNDSRYHGLNLHARVYLGTIEFRYHSGTNNPTKIKNWITICQAIVQKGIEVGREYKAELTEYDKATKEILFTNGDLGIEKFIKYLELEDIEEYIIKRFHKFYSFNKDNMIEQDIEYLNIYNI